jgi:hypothetical protein
MVVKATWLIDIGPQLGLNIKLVLAASASKLIYTSASAVITNRLIILLTLPTLNVTVVGVLELKAN